MLALLQLYWATPELPLDLLSRNLENIQHVPQKRIYIGKINDNLIRKTRLAIYHIFISNLLHFPDPSLLFNQPKAVGGAIYGNQLPCFSRARGPIKES